MSISSEEVGTIPCGCSECTAVCVCVCVSQLDQASSPEHCASLCPPSPPPSSPLSSSPLPSPPAQVMPFKSFMEGLGLEPESPSLFLTPLPLLPSSASASASRSRKLLSFLSDSCYLSPSSSSSASLPPLSPAASPPPSSPPESPTSDDVCSCCSGSATDSDPDVLEQSLLDQFSTQRLSSSSSTSLSPPGDRADNEEGFAFAQLVAPSAVVNSDPRFSLGNASLGDASSSPPPPIACPQALDFCSEALEGPHLSYAFRERGQEEEKEGEGEGEFLVTSSLHHYLNNSAHGVYGGTAVPSQDREETGAGEATQLLCPAVDNAHTEHDVVGPLEPSATEQASISATASSAAAVGSCSLLDGLHVDLALLDDLPLLDTELPSLLAPSPAHPAILSAPSPAHPTGRSPLWQGPAPLPAVQRGSTPRPGQAGRRAMAGHSNNKENALSSGELGSAGLPFGPKSLLSERNAQGGGHLRPALHSLDNVAPAGLHLLRGVKGHRKQVSHSDTPRPLKKRAS